MPRKVFSKRKKNNFKLVVISTGLLITIGSLIFYFINNNSKKDTFKEAQFEVRGVDLSHHNPIINWQEVKTDNNLSFVYIKATGGVNHIDRNYKYNYESARKSNVKVGAYHFYLFGVSGERQAQHFIKNMIYQSGDLYPAIDVEHSKDNVYSQDTAYVKRVIGELLILESELYNYFGVHPIIYTNKDGYKLYVKNNFQDNYIWMCDLHNEPKDVMNWIIWQFSHKGRLNGVVGDIDMNYFRYSYNDLSKITLP